MNENTATITLADVHGAIETYEVQNTLFMQIWDLLHAAGCNKIDKLTLPEVMIVKNKDYGMPGYVNPDSKGFKQIDPGLQVRSSLDEFIAPVSDDKDIPARVVPEIQENPAEATTGSVATPSGAVSDMDFMASLARLMSKTK